MTVGIDTSAQSTPQRRVLIFDNDRQVLETTQRVFEHHGCAVRTVLTREELFHAMRVEHPDIVVLDLAVQEADAAQVFGAICENCPTAKVVTFSGPASATLALNRRLGESMGLRITGAIEKPFKRPGVRLPAASRSLGPGRRRAKPTGNPQEPDLLAQALAQGWVEFWYQPKVDLDSFGIAGAECLARVRHPELGILPPGDFLARATLAGLHELSCAALIDASGKAGASAQDGRPIEVGINLAANTLEIGDLLESLLRARGAPTGTRIVLELTETDPLLAPERLEEFSAWAVRHGFGISIDDFGHGYATFERLRRAPFCELKLDRAIVQGCATDHASRSICRAAVELAHAFGAKAVAEGIETEEDLMAARALGFDVAQGFLFSAPVPWQTFRMLPAQFTSAAGRAAGRCA